MATDLEKEELIEILKFTPKTYTINISGYGGEIAIGNISKEAYEYWVEKTDEDDGETLYDFNDDWDNELEVPEEFRIFEPGEWSECDNIAHESGAEMSDLNPITVSDENGNTVWSCSMLPGDLDDEGVNCEEIGEVYISTLPKGSYVFVGQATEKGTLYDGKFEITAPFDPKKLRITYSDIDGWSLLSSITYLDKDIENIGYSTYGKGMDLGIFKIENDAGEDN
jgi:hypothetical protein